MPALKKYRERYITSVAIERSERDIAEALKIPLSDALRLGLNFAIKMRISDNDSRVTPEILEQFAEIELQDLQDLKAYIRLKNEETETLQKMVEIKKETKKDEEIITVWDDAIEEYIQIKRSQFDPQWHTIRKAKT